jgi:hypothetical protein
MLATNPSIYEWNIRKEKFSTWTEFDFYGLSSIQKFRHQNSAWPNPNFVDFLMNSVETGRIC